MTTPPPADAKATFRALRRREVRARMRSTIIWTIVGLLVVVGACAAVVADRGATWIVLTCLVGAVVVLGIATVVALQAAGRRATSQMVRAWAIANGFAYWGRDMPAEPTPNPQESRFDDHMLATETFPEATPLLRKGTRRYVTDVVAGTIAGMPVRLANHCYEEDRYDADGNVQTTYTYHLVALMPLPARVTPMRLVRRSRTGRAMKGAADALAGVGSMKAVDMENADFNRVFALRVDDMADMVVLFQVFDHLVQERMADGRDAGDLSLIEAQGGWLMLADDGIVSGTNLERLDSMCASVRWAADTLC